MKQAAPSSTKACIRAVLLVCTVLAAARTAPAVCLHNPCADKALHTSPNSRRRHLTSPHLGFQTPSLKSDALSSKQIKLLGTQILPQLLHAASSICRTRSLLSPSASPICRSVRGFRFTGPASSAK